MDFRAEQRFVDVNVAEPGDHRLVHERVLDHSFLLAQRGEQRVERGRPRVGPPGFFKVDRGQRDAAELTHVAVHQVDIRIEELEAESHIGVGLFVFFEEQQRAGHAEMNFYVAAGGQRPEDGLAVAGNGRDARPLEDGTEFPRLRL